MNIGLYKLLHLLNRLQLINAGLVGTTLLALSWRFWVRVVGIHEQVDVTQDVELVLGIYRQLLLQCVFVKQFYVLFVIFGLIYNEWKPELCGFFMVALLVAV